MNFLYFNRKFFNLDISDVIEATEKGLRIIKGATKFDLDFNTIERVKELIKKGDVKLEDVIQVAVQLIGMFLINKDEAVLDLTSKLASLEVKADVQPVVDGEPVVSTIEEVTPVECVKEGGCTESVPCVESCVE